MTVTPNGTPRIDPEIKKLWTTALRSGEWKQITGRLAGKYVYSEPERVGVGYCCLGVLAELALKDGVGSYRWREDQKYYVDDAMECGSALPVSVLEWAGLDKTQDFLVALTEIPIQLPREYWQDNLHGFDEGRTCLSALNDQYHFTFAQIADVIDYFL